MCACIVVEAPVRVQKQRIQTGGGAGVEVKSGCGGGAEGTSPRLPNGSLNPFVPSVPATHECDETIERGEEHHSEN